MGMKPDKFTCGGCDAFVNGESVVRGFCHLVPPVGQSGSQVDPYPEVMGDNVGCLQHSSRVE